EDEPTVLGNTYAAGSVLHALTALTKAEAGGERVAEAVCLPLSLQTQVAEAVSHMAGRVSDEGEEYVWRALRLMQKAVPVLAKSLSRKSEEEAGGSGSMLLCLETALSLANHFSEVVQGEASLVVRALSLSPPLFQGDDSLQWQDRFFALMLKCKASLDPAADKAQRRGAALTVPHLPVSMLCGPNGFLGEMLGVLSVAVEG
ncbi:hypothetical protein KIPB_012688, partial [Kipferlia bialata]